MYRLTIFKEGQRVGEHELPRPVTSLGRHTDNDVVLDDLALSRFHARLEQRGERHTLVDLGSQNGTFVNGVRISSPLDLNPGDRLGLGRYVAVYDLDPMEKEVRRQAQDPDDQGEGPSLLLMQQGQEMERFPLTGEGYVIGRSQRCDIVIGLLGLSRRHARVYPSPEGWHLEDLQSQNGTFLNTQRIAGATPLAPGDVINFFEYTLVYQDGPRILGPQPTVPMRPPESTTGPTTPLALSTLPNPTGPLREATLTGDSESDLAAFEGNSTLRESSAFGAEPTDRRLAQGGWPSAAEVNTALTASGQRAVPFVLEVQVDGALVTEVPLDRAALSIGADARCDVALPPLPGVSAWHLVVVRMGGCVLMNRVSDSALPYVAGSRAAQAFLAEGQRIELGRVTLVLRRR